MKLTVITNWNVT